MIINSDCHLKCPFNYEKPEPAVLSIANSLDHVNKNTDHDSLVYTTRAVAILFLASSRLDTRCFPLCFDPNAIQLPLTGKTVDSV
jgi:hypothetical protein